MGLTCKYMSHIHPELRIGDMPLRFGKAKKGVKETERSIHLADKKSLPKISFLDLGLPSFICFII